MLRPTWGLGLVDRVAKGILYISGFLVIGYAFLLFVMVPVSTWMIQVLAAWGNKAVFRFIDATEPWCFWVFWLAVVAGMWLFYRQAFRFVTELIHGKE